jgi:hypothetical protein
VDGYAKLWGTIVHSTIWRETPETKVVWVTMLALADSTGYVGASVPGLADVARVSVDACRAALGLFLAPDPDSRTTDYGGRRIREESGGWRLLNYGKHREGVDQEHRRKQNREASRRHRERRKLAASAETSARVSESKQLSAQAEAEAEAEALSTTISAPRKRKRPVPPDWTPSEKHRAIAFAEGRDCEREAEKFRDWSIANGKTCIDPDAAFRNWLRSEYGRGVSHETISAKNLRTLSEYAAREGLTDALPGGADG